MKKHQFKVFLLLTLLPIILFIAVRERFRAQRTHELVSNLSSPSEDFSIETAKQLINRGVDVNAHTETGQPIIEMLAERNNWALVNILREQGASTTPATERFWREGAVWNAVWNGDSVFIKKMLQENFDPNSCQKDSGYSLLMAAAKWEKTEIVRLLLSFGANPNKRDNDGYSAIYTAFYSGWRSSRSHTIINILRKAGAQPTANELLLIAIQENDLSAARNALLWSANVNQIEPPDSATPLMWAAGHGRPAIVQLLLKNGAKVEFANSGNLALDWASRRYFPARNAAYDETIKILYSALQTTKNVPQENAKLRSHAAKERQK